MEHGNSSPTDEAFLDKHSPETEAMVETQVGSQGGVAPQIPDRSNECRFWDSTQRSLGTGGQTSAGVPSFTSLLASTHSPLQLDLASNKSAVESESLVCNSKSVDSEGKKDESVCVHNEPESSILPSGSPGLLVTCASPREKSEDCKSLTQFVEITLKHVCAHVSGSTGQTSICKCGTSQQFGGAGNVETRLSRESGSSSYEIESLRTVVDKEICAHATHPSSTASPLPPEVTKGSCSPKTPPGRSADPQDPGAPVKVRIERGPPTTRLRGRARRRLNFDNL